jgi:hypothetical protein
VTRQTDSLSEIRAFLPLMRISLDRDRVLLAFVRQNIRSVWALELLLLLKRDHGRCWPEADLVIELRASQMVVAENLQRLQDSALVVRDDKDCWRYAPAATPLEEACDSLEAAYRERPVTVINMIAKPDPLQTLADAFKFRGE